MKRSNLLPFVFLVASCSNPRSPQTLFAKLEIKHAPNAFLGRQVAGDSPVQCFKDTFTVESVQAEIAQLEKQYASGTRVQGTWKHLKLADLPIPQANFLKTYGKKIGDLKKADAIDYSGCQDVPCIYNRIYGKDGDIAGYVHYLWYLKMGHMLAADNEVFNMKEDARGLLTVADTQIGFYNGKEQPLAAYLWSEKELFAFWRLTKMLKGIYTQTSTIIEVQRIPRGEEFNSVFEDKQRRDAEVKRRLEAKLPTIEEENRQREKQGLPRLDFDVGGTCGVAWTGGQVNLQDGCLTVYEDRDDGYFYPAVTHELSHQIDFFEGRKKYNATYRSQQKDYYEAAGYELVTYKDASGKVTETLKTKPGFKSVTFYAGTSLAENFAETLAYFRVDGETAKRNMMEEHKKFTSTSYFQNKHFDPESLHANWISDNQARLTQAAFSAVGACAKESGTKPSPFFAATDFTVKLLPSMVNCLGAKATELAADLMAKVRLGEPQGCRELKFDSKKQGFQKALKAQLLPLLNKYLLEVQKDQAYFARVQAFYDEIPNKQIAGNAYVTCYTDEDPQGCYIEETVRLVGEKIKPLNLPVEHAEELADLYLGAHDFEGTKQYVDDVYRTFVASHQQIVVTQAEELWQSCQNVPVDDTLSPSGKNFTVGNGYMASSIYNCLNQQFPETVKVIVRDLAVDGQKLQHPNEELIMTGEVTPALRKLLLETYQRESVKELARLTALIPEEAAKARALMTGNFSWVKDVINTEATQATCEARALTLAPVEPKYNLKQELYKDFVRRVCQDITSSAEYGAWLESSRSEFQSKAYDSLEAKVVSFASTKARECLKQFPIDTNLNRVKYKKDREACLVGDWYLYEASALKEFKEDPLVVKFNLDLLPMQGRLEESRRRLQLKIMKEFYEK